MCREQSFVSKYRPFQGESIHDEIRYQQVCKLRIVLGFQAALRIAQSTEACATATTRCVLSTTSRRLAVWDVTPWALEQQVNSVIKRYVVCMCVMFASKWVSRLRSPVFQLQYDHNKSMPAPALHANTRKLHAHRTTLALLGAIFKVFRCPAAVALQLTCPQT